MQDESSVVTTPAVARMGVSPRFPKPANYLKSYTQSLMTANWTSELIPTLEIYGKGAAGTTFRADGKTTLEYLAACNALHFCADALHWHAVQAALGSREPQVRGPAKPVTQVATRRELAKLINNGRHIHGSVWLPNLSRYFDETQYDYSIKFAKELDETVSSGEFMIVRHLLLNGHAANNLEAALLEHGVALAQRKGDGLPEYVADTVRRALADDTLKKWAAERDAAQRDAQALAGSGVEWLDFWRRSVAYQYASCRMARHSGRVSYWVLDLVNTMAFCLWLGWTEQALALFHQYAERLVTKGFDDYDKSKRPFFQRRTQYFLLRLLADWQGIMAPPMPPQADDEPIFTVLLAHWRAPDPEAIVPALLAACDRHTHYALIKKDSADFHSSGDLTYLPFEILAVLRLREMLGLPHTVLDHPLMNTPLGALPPLSEPYEDELLKAVMTQARKEFAGL